MGKRPAAFHLAKSLGNGFFFLTGPANEIGNGIINFLYGCPRYMITVDTLNVILRFHFYSNSSFYHGFQGIGRETTKSVVIINSLITALLK